jgi:predicted secreted protein
MSRLALAGLAGLVINTASGEPVLPQGVVSLWASASVAVARELMTIAVGTVREGPGPGAVQSQLEQPLDAALDEARRAAKPGQIDVHSGNFSIVARYDMNGRISVWIGTAEGLIEGRDMQPIGALSGRITTMTIGRVGYGLSRELREKVEADVAAQAIGSFPARASDYAKQFGHSGHAVGEVSVSSTDAASRVPMTMLRAKPVSAQADESSPVEPGKGSVSIAVSGTVQLTK